MEISLRGNSRLVNIHSHCDNKYEKLQNYWGRNDNNDRGYSNVIMYAFADTLDAFTARYVYKCFTHSQCKVFFQNHRNLLLSKA